MFPALKGQHYPMDCDDCGFHFAIDATSTPRSGEAVCPNCGYPHNSFADLNVRPSDRYRLLPSPSDLNRWDLAGIRMPQQTGVGPRAVKRIVGLPGERIEIRGGNVFADGQLLVKPLAVQRQMLVPVFDSQHVPPNSPVPRFTTADEGLPWQRQASGDWILTSTSGPTASPWFTYRHLRGYRHRGDRYQYAPIEDSYGYNQNVARSLHDVDEVMVTINVNCEKKSPLAIRLVTHCQQIDTLIDFEHQRLWLAIDSQRHTIPFPDNRTPKSVALAHWDSEITILLNDQAIGRFPLSNTSVPTTEDRPLEISLGFVGTDRLPRIRLHRDIHYFVDPPTQLAVWQLRENEYFLLGDNVPVSVDSRRYGPVQRSQMIGKLLIDGEPAGLETGKSSSDTNIR